MGVRFGYNFRGRQTQDGMSCSSSYRAGDRLWWWGSEVKSFTQGGIP